MAAREIAQHYNARDDSGTGRRSQRDCFELRKLNNWVKTVLIDKFAAPGCSVLDLGCGKGGDLIKFGRKDVGLYVGADIARESVSHACVRYNQQKTKENIKFGAFWIAADCFGVDLEPLVYRAVGQKVLFEAISCQFVFHYAFESEQRLRIALSNISKLLRPGSFFFGTSVDANIVVKSLRNAGNSGRFGNQFVEIRANPQDFEHISDDSPFGIKYHFKLEDAVDCPEFLMPFPILIKIAKTYDLELAFVSNFHQFFVRYSDASKYPQFADMLRKIWGFKKDCRMPKEQWDVASLYLAFAFQKKGLAVIPQRQLPQYRPCDPATDIVIDASALT